MKLFSQRNIFIGVIIVLAVIYFITSNKTTENFETDEDGHDQYPTLKCIMFYTEWCGYCKKAKPEWERLKSEMHGKIVDGKRIIVTGIDCDKNEQIAKQYKVSGYPTFKFEMDDKVMDYDGENTFDAFKRFIQGL